MKHRQSSRSLEALLCLAALLPSLGCAVALSSVTSDLAADLTAAALNQDDPQTVRDGAPAFLLMIDGLVEGSPRNVRLLLAGAQLYGAYTGAFVEDPERAKRLSDKALDYSVRALREDEPGLAAAMTLPLDAYSAALAEVEERDLAVLFGFASAWAGWVQTHSADWSAIADLPKVEATMRRVIELDDGYQDGLPHVFLGVLLTLRPTALGGEPEVGREHFERAIELSDGRNLMAKVLFAERYARLVFDRELHDRLLEEVLAADPMAPGLTLSNVMAQEEAGPLLADSPEYF